MRALLLGVALLLSAGTSAGEGEPAPEDPSSISENPVFSVDTAIGPIDYRLGRGLRVGRTGLTLGGFSTLESEVAQDGEYALEFDTNLIAQLQPIPYFRALAELELGEIFVVEEAMIESNLDLGVERLYGDLLANDKANVRFGKFLTPVGRWNQVPFEPLLWTVTEPLGVEEGFDEAQTGAAFFGAVYPGSGVLNYNVYSKFLPALDGDSTTANYSAGGRLEYSDVLGAWSVGTSFLASRRNGIGWEYLGGLDGVLRWKNLQVTVEGLYSNGSYEPDSFWDVYVMGVYEIGCSFYTVARYEYYHPLVSGIPPIQIGDFGLAWYPWPFLNVKAGYRVSSRETEEVTRGFTGAISFLF